jgi:hypothetical protein
MQAAQPISLARRWIDDPTTSGRWTTGDMLDELTSACKQLMRDILFPECRITTETYPNIQRYTLPEIIEIHAVYVQGQLAVPAPSIDTLEGDQLQIWDQTSEQGYGPSYAYGSTPWPYPLPPYPGYTPPPPGPPPTFGPVPGGAGPSGNTGAFAPKWTVQTPAMFPGGDEFSQYVWPAPITVPWQGGQRPRYAIEGGSILIVPAPATGPIIINGEIQNNLDIRCVIPHETVVDLDQNLWFPSNCASALARWIVADLLFADETQIGQARATLALQRYEREKNQQRTDANVYRGARSQNAPKVITGRQYWRGQIHRTGPF